MDAELERFFKENMDKCYSITNESMAYFRVIRVDGCTLAITEVAEELTYIFGINKDESNALFLSWIEEKLIA